MRTVTGKNKEKSSICFPGMPYSPPESRKNAVLCYASKSRERLVVVAAAWREFCRCGLSGWLADDGNSGIMSNIVLKRVELVIGLYTLLVSSLP